MEMLLSMLLETSEGNINYLQLNELAQKRAKWSWWKQKPAQKSKIHKKRQTHSLLKQPHNRTNSDGIFIQIV